MGYKVDLVDNTELVAEGNSKSYRILENGVLQLVNTEAKSSDKWYAEKELSPHAWRAVEGTIFAGTGRLAGSQGSSSGTNFYPSGPSK